MKLGLEIHRRLDTNKLFCECPSLLMEDRPPDITLNRRQHPVVSELGDIDGASKVEFQRKRTFQYQVFDNCNCLVESDEEPPHPLNKEALNIALEVSTHLNSDIVDELHVMRKIVIDGSNTAGFQRTAVLGLNGSMDTSKGKVRISSIALEEESAGIIGKKDSVSIFRLDRLGIPLIEIATEPDIKDGEHLKETAEKLGAILRSTGKVMRGIGTIRQDVNVSIEGGARVEIKGAQDLKLLPLLVQNEVDRQKKLIEINKEIEKRFNGTPKLTFNPINLSEIFTNTNSGLIKAGLSKGEKIFGIKLQNYKGLLGTELYQGKRYGSELSDYAKSAGVKGIIHSDEDLSKYKINEQEINEISKILKTTKEDCFVLVVAEQETAKRALSNVIERAKILKVTEETRRANADASSSYMRPLPGKARMYPETDIPPVELTNKLLKEMKKEMSDSLEEKKKKLEKLLKNKELAERMVKSKNLNLFQKLVKEKNDPVLVANTLENTLIALRREGVIFLELEKPLKELFKEYKKGKFAKSAIPDILLEMSKGKIISKILDDKNLHKLKGKELEKIVKENKGDIKEIMRNYRLRVEPEDVVRLTKNKKSK